jgi:hypothetical protein
VCVLFYFILFFSHGTTKLSELFLQMQLWGWIGKLLRVAYFMEFISRSILILLWGNSKSFFLCCPVYFEIVLFLYAFYTIRTPRY